MTNTDTYYRGYRLAESTTAPLVKVYYGTDLVETTDTIDRARGIIDSWMEAK